MIFGTLFRNHEVKPRCRWFRVMQMTKRWSLGTNFRRSVSFRSVESEGV